MAQQINVPGVGVLSFPDGMADADIQTAIHKNFPQLGPAPQASQDGIQPSDVGGFLKQMAQSGGRQLMNAAVGIPGIFADGTAQAYNYLHGRNAPTLQQTAAGQPGDYPFPVLPSQDFKNRLAPVLGQRPDGAAGIAEDVGSAVIGSKMPMPGQAPALPAAQAQAAALTTRAAQVQTLKNAGVDLDAHQDFGGKLALTLKNAVNDGAYSSAQEFRDQQSSQFTRAALKEMGVDADEATPAVMQAGRKVLKDNYNAIAARTNLQVDSGLNNAIGSIRYASQRALTPDNARVIENQLQDIETMAARNGGKISGAGYQQLQSALGDVANDGGKSPFVTQIRQALTDALGRQASPADAKLLAQTNQRYGAMKSVEKAIGDDNLVSPNRLYNAMDSVKGANQSVYGQGANTRLMDLAQAGKAILGTGTANSGTPTRLAGMAALGTAGAAVGAAVHGQTGEAAALLSGAAALGLSQNVAKTLVYNPAGREWLRKFIAAKGVAMSTALPQTPAGVVGGLAAGSVSNQSQPPETTP